MVTVVKQVFLEYDKVMARTVFSIHIISLVIFGLFLSDTVTADESALTIEATVDRDVATVEDEVILSIEVKGTRSAAQPHLNLPDTFQVVSQGQSTNVRIVNGQMSASVIYTYSLFPQKAGKYTIGPFTLETKSGVIQSNQLLLTVTPAESMSGNNAQTDNELYITHEVSNLTPYRNEQIIYTTRFFRRVEITNAEFTSLPKLDAFWQETIWDDRRYRQIINGQNYIVFEMKKALFPSKEGTIHIASPTLKVNVVVHDRSRRRRSPLSDLFDTPFNTPFNTQTRRKILKTAPIEVRVQPLPEIGRPSNFTGLVGEFNIEATVSKPTLSQGESTTLTIRVFGKGNLRSLKNPFQGEITDLKIYDDQPTLSIDTDQAPIQSEKIFKKALLPLKPMTYTIPPIALSYFDPAHHQYRTVTTPSLSLTATPAPGNTPDKHLKVVSPPTTTSNKKEITVLAKDILPIATDRHALSHVKLSTQSGMGLFILPAVVYLLLAWVQIVRESHSKNPQLVAQKRALSHFKSAVARMDGNNHLDNGHQALRTYIKEKLAMDHPVQTVQEIHEHLKPFPIKKETIHKLNALLQTYEAAKYGRQQLGDVKDQKTHKHLLITVVKSLDQQLSH